MFRIWSSLVLLAVCVSAEQADWIVSGRYLVTMDAQRRVIENGAVAVKGSRIAAVGPRAQIDKQFTPKSRLDDPSAILTPGLINAHTHAPMSLFRGIADDLNLQEWLEKYIFPAEAKNVTPEFVRWGTRLACVEMLLSGTTTYADMYYFEEVIAEATKECGMRGVLGQTIIQFPVPDAKTPMEGLKRAEAFLERFRGDDLVTAAVAPHAVYTNSDDVLRASRELANKYKAPLLIHLSETRKENEDLHLKRGMTPVRLLDLVGLFNGWTLAAHGVFVNAEDMRTLKARGVGIAHCPSSNMKLASGVAPVVDYLNADMSLGLGTDGVAGSNNDVNMFEEMDLAAKLQKVIRNDPTAVRAEQAFEMATIRGARAVGLDKDIGSIEAGKRADMILIRSDGPNAMPMYNVFSHLVYALKGSDVRHVMVNGKLVVRDRRVLTVSVPQVLAKAGELKLSIQRSIGGRAR
jgi:5-methylthioadenosine/S-adenosylhomocysteine deaminase